MAGEDPNDPRTVGLPPVPDLIQAATPVKRGNKVTMRWGTRVGVIPDFTAGSSATAVARKAFLDQLASIQGIQAVDVQLPEGWKMLTSTAFNNVRLPERSEPFLPLMHKDLRSFGVSVTGWLQGSLLGANEYVLGQCAKVLLLERVLNGLFEQCDVVLQTSPNPFDAIGLPELALPIGFDAPGVPIGTILGGQSFAEDRLLAVAAAYQAVTNWHLRRPANPAGDSPKPIAVDPSKSRKPLAKSARGKVPGAPVPQGRGCFQARKAAGLSQSFPEFSPRPGAPRTEPPLHRSTSYPP